MYPDIPLLQNISSNNFFLIAGPCVVEDEEMIMKTATHLKAVCSRLEIPFIFKSSFRKANRSAHSSFTGIGDEKALRILEKVRWQLQVPVVTDIHESHEAALAAKYVDVLQIPAFLCRQTDLIIAAAKTGKAVNIKKGQFLSAASMKHAIDKCFESGNKNVFLTERGNSFGYSDLVVDYRNIVEMQKFKVPVMLDCTHSVQQPNSAAGVTGGKPEFIETIAKAGVAVGVDGLFIETHPNPSVAKSDGSNMLKLELIEPLLEKLLKIRKAIAENKSNDKTAFIQ